MTELAEFKKELRENANKTQAQNLQRFFKTGKGEYGEGDVFLGIKVPVQRSIANKYNELNLQEIQQLLGSEIHEERLSALFMLIKMYKKSSSKKEIFEFYMKNYNNINNWDLVDLSAPNISGEYLLDKSKQILYDFAKSDHLWKKRIAVLSTFYFIKNNKFDDSLKIAEILLQDKHDLIHKAIGWMLREIGKRNQEVEEEFLQKHCKTMPRTMLRYAIEKFSDLKRRQYLGK